MSKNGYLERRQKTIDVYRRAERETYTQFMMDIFIATLNDPDVMGRDTFGEKRIRKVVQGIGQKYNEYFDAICDGPEADYVQEKLDGRLKQALGEQDFQPFSERYDWIKKQTY